MCSFKSLDASRFYIMLTMRYTCSVYCFSVDVLIHGEISLFQIAAATNVDIILQNRVTDIFNWKILYHWKFNKFLFFPLTQIPFKSISCDDHKFQHFSSSLSLIFDFLKSAIVVNGVYDANVGFISATNVLL